jgi:hypothetical protein
VESLPAVSEWRTKVKKFNTDQLALVYWFLVHNNYRLEYCTTLSQVNLPKLFQFKFLNNLMTLNELSDLDFDAKLPFIKIFC